jgi:LemA protein
MITTPIIVIALIIVFVLILVGMYNGFVRSKNRVDESWADIDVQLKRRYDLIPNLIETVKGYAQHEAQTLEAVIAARNAAYSAEQSGNVASIAVAENALGGAMRGLWGIAESYPDLKANASFVELQRELSDTEDKIQAARRFYNANVRDWNTKREMFPGSLFAGLFGFGARDLYTLSDTPEQRENISVSFTK